MDTESIFIFNMKGIFTPIEIQTLDTITWTEKALLSIYYYFTTEGKYKCCSMKNEDLYKNELKISKNTFERAKKHLKELGYIRTNGGIRVWYLGIKPKETKEIEETVETTVEVETVEPIEETVETVEIKEEIVEEVEPIKEKNEVMDKTNFERIVEQLPREFQKEEYITYVKEENSQFIKNLNSFEYGDLNLQQYLTQIREVINQRFHPYADKEVEQKSILKEEFFGTQKSEYEIEQEKEDNELFSWLENIAIEPKVEYGRI